ncbi:MAG: hypothetical protein K6G32_15300 [Prevotella sp.]|nr:hypothetical protein [Prevotella sp.]
MASLPVQTPTPAYHTLEDIRLRKEQLYDELQHDSQQFSTLWGQVFKNRENSSRSEFIGSVVANSVTAVDLFLLFRKLMKTYGKVFKKGKKKK